MNTGPLLLLSLVASALVACGDAPHVMNPFLRVTPGNSALLEREAWHSNWRPGDRYAVGGPDLRFGDRLVLGPPDDANGRCTMREDGDVEVVAPLTSGHWPCLLRVCRVECMIARLTVVAEDPEPAPDSPSR